MIPGETSLLAGTGDTSVPALWMGIPKLRRGTGNAESRPAWHHLRRHFLFRRSPAHPSCRDHRVATIAPVKSDSGCHWPGQCRSEAVPPS